MGNNPSSPQTQKQRLESLQREMAALRIRTDRSRNLTLLIGVAALVILGAYFYYGYKEVSVLMDPEKIVSLGEQTLEEHLPKARTSLEEQVIKSAPSWAENLSKQALDSLPSARGKLEEYALEQYQAGFHELSALTQGEFRTYLRKNRPLLETKFKELASQPKLADSSLAEIEKSLEEQLQSDMKAEAGQLLQTLKASNAHLAKLRTNKDLDAEEKVERKVVMLARRMQLEQTDPAALSKFKAEPEAQKPSTVKSTSPAKGQAPKTSPVPEPGKNKAAGSTTEPGKDAKKP